MSLAGAASVALRGHGGAVKSWIGMVRLGETGFGKAVKRKRSE